MSKKERRDYLRKPYFAEIQIAGAKESFFYSAINLGIGGVFLRTEHPWEPGTELTVTLPTREGSGYFEIKGRVAWARGADEFGEFQRTGTPGMGIRFENVGDAERQALKALIDSISRKQA